jgi:hypothetical protein
MNHRTHPSAATEQQRISNFLYPDDALSPGALPERFIEFCRTSIEGVRGDVLYTESAIAPTFNVPEFDDEDARSIELNQLHEERIVPLKPTKSNRPIAAIDTSTIKLGELADGTLCALRGAVVLLENGRYRYVRYGPLIFSLGNNSFADFSGFGNLTLSPFTGEPNVDSLLKRVRNILERWLQFSVSSSISNGFVLIDGSLTAGTPDNPSKELERILETARRNRSIVAAISKKTKLRINNKSITELLEHRIEPCLLNVDAEVTEQFPPYPVRFLGRVFVGRLAKSGYPFRMDVDREIPLQDTVTGLQQLTGTDIVDQGYPETLRMAHILSTFTASDVLAMQVVAAAQFGVQLIPKLALRRSLFGPFGTAWEAWH